MDSNINTSSYERKNFSDSTEVRKSQRGQAELLNIREEVQ
jgi:hypothetical protein